jgi:NAD(P)-dependent dehydrogenase (short-subunit alcohol dehydrogenase family)
MTSPSEIRISVIAAEVGVDAAVAAAHKAFDLNADEVEAVVYGPEGIRVNGICPTYAKTALRCGLHANTDFMHAFAESVPLKRFGEMRYIANLALYLVGDESIFVHGPLIHIDGEETLFRHSV